MSTWVVHHGGVQVSEPQVGATYVVKNNRKRGPFTGKILKVSEPWCWVEITEGRAIKMMSGDVSEVGEVVQVRDTSTVFTLVEVTK